MAGEVIRSENFLLIATSAQRCTAAQIRSARQSAQRKPVVAGSFESYGQPGFVMERLYIPVQSGDRVSAIPKIAEV